MKDLINCLRIALVLAVATVLLSLQTRPADSSQDVRLPSGKSQKEAILKMEYEKSLEDAGRLLELAEDLKIELEKSDRHILSLNALKKTEEIEKLAKRIRKRLRR
jgi:hypothetical protein